MASTNSETCGHCDGKGHIAAFGHYANGICFACDGTGIERHARVRKEHPINVTVAQRTLLETASESQIRALETAKLRELCSLACKLANAGDLPRERHLAFGVEARKRQCAAGIRDMRERGLWPNERQRRFLCTATRKQIEAASDPQLSKIRNAALMLSEHDAIDSVQRDMIFDVFRERVEAPWR